MTTNIIEISLRHTFGAKNAKGASSTNDNQPFTLDIQLRIPATGVTTIFGESGSGKTSLLRCIAGLTRAHHGLIKVGGEIWQDEQVFVKAHERPVGYVFQEASLFEHLTVLGNLDFALRRAPSSAKGVGFDQVVQILQLEELLTRRPGGLSGGEKQRVAMARAVLVKPGILLMDEPLASLDARRKNEILPFLERLRDEIALPIIYVTHSLDEVARLADYVVALQEGRVQASGALSEVLADTSLPMQQDEQAGVVINAEVVERDTAWQLIRLSSSAGDLWLPDTTVAGNNSATTDDKLRHTTDAGNNGVAAGNKLRLRVLARDVSLSLTEDKASSILNRIPATVTAIDSAREGSMQLVKLQAGEVAFLARLTRKSVQNLNLQPGLQVWAQFKSVAILH
ncbi:MAG: molybdenum ABC transporter ATP-binding protein [Pseudohongiellaceae bacterium]